MLDTDILIHFINRKENFDRIARRMSGRSPGELRLSAITPAELRFGIEKGKFRSENRKALAEISAGGRFAAHARHLGAVLVTNNEREFRRVPALSVQNWLKA